MPKGLRSEPVLLMALLVVALNAIQVAVIPGVSSLAHTIIAIVIIALGAVLARLKVTSVSLNREPVMIVNSIVAVLTLIQGLVLSIPPGVHAAIACVIVGLGAVVARANVTPSA